MIPLELAGSFLCACTLLALAPGPDNLFVLTQSIAHGRKAGLFATLGFCCGCVVHTTAIALGLTALIHSYPTAFTALKLAGAGYLILLAVQAFRTSARSLEDAHTTTVLSHAQYFRRGMIMNITNPKVTLFFIAFFPQFTDPTRGPLALQLLMLGGLFILSTILVFGGIACLAGGIQSWLTPKAQRAIHVLAAVVYLGLAGYIANTHV